MGHIRKNLSPNEQIVYETKLHWKIFILPILTLLLAGYFYTQGWAWLSRIFAIGGSLSLVGMLMKFLTNEFVITTNNLRFRQGFFPESDRIPLDKISRVKLKSRYNPVDILLDCGSMLVFTDSDNKIEFKNISSPGEFDKRANQQLNDPLAAAQSLSTQPHEKEFWRKLPASTQEFLISIRLLSIDDPNEYYLSYCSRSAEIRRYKTLSRKVEYLQQQKVKAAKEQNVDKKIHDVRMVLALCEDMLSPTKGIGFDFDKAPESERKSFLIMYHQAKESYEEYVKQQSGVRELKK